MTYLLSIISETENRIQFLSDFIRKRFVFAEGKSVAESDILYLLKNEYWQVGKGCIPKEMKSDLVECINKLIPEAKRKKISKKNKNKKVYPLYIAFHG